MEEDDKLRLRVNQVYVAQNVELCDIIDHLIGQGIVDDDLYHLLKNKYVNPTPKDSMTNLLIKLPMKGPDAYQVFYTSLSEHYHHVQKRLDETDLQQAREKFAAAGNSGPESSQEVLQNFLRSVTSLMATMNSGQNLIAAQEWPLSNTDESGAGENPPSSSEVHQPLETEAVQPDHQDRQRDVPDSGPREEIAAMQVVEDFNDEEIKEFIVKRISSLSEMSDKLDTLLTFAMDYIQLLQESFEERKHQTMFFAEAVEAMTSELQFKLSELDRSAQELTREIEDVMTWSSEEITSKQRDIIDLITRMEQAEMNVMRAAKLVHPIAAEAHRCKYKDRRSQLCALS